MDRRAVAELAPSWSVRGRATLALTYMAHLNGRPVTSAIVAVFGVMAVGALLGLRAGAIAGLAASFTYNVLFIEPALTFTYSTADDLVPMLALTLGAVGSGLTAGRLRDRALAAEQARERLSELLHFSQDLQTAVTVADVQSVARSYLGSDRSSVHLILAPRGELEPGSGPSWTIGLAEELWYSGLPHLTFRDLIGFLLRSRERRLGVLLVETGQASASPASIGIFLPLIVLAIQRCRLAEQLAESDVLRRSEKFKTAMLSSVSHDLRTPLAAISAAAGGLADLDRLDEETLGRPHRDDRGAVRPARPLYREPAQPGPIRTGPRRRPHAGGRCTRGAWRHPRPCSATERSPDHPPRSRGRFRAVRAEESLLEQIFFNVLENAVAHTPADTSIRVTAQADGNRLVIAVEDDGPGIPPKDHERVFERFIRSGPAPAARARASACRSPAVSPNSSAGPLPPRPRPARWAARGSRLHCLWRTNAREEALAGRRRARDQAGAGARAQGRRLDRP